MDNGRLQWPSPVPNSLATLNQIPLPAITQSDDSIEWLLHSSKVFTLKSAWNNIREKRDQLPSHNILWKSPTVPRCAFISWLAVKGRLPTLDKLQQWNIHLPNRCILCKQAEESLDHIFCQCQYTKVIWSQVWSDLTITPLLGNSVIGWCHELALKSRGKDQMSKMRRLALTLGFYNIWRERNARIFMEVCRPSVELAVTISSSVRIILHS